MPITSTTVDVRKLLAQTLFQAMGPDLVEFLAQQAVVERYEVPTLLQQQGAPLLRLRYVVAGNIALTVRHPSGREVVVSDIGAGGWATWIPCLTDAPPEQDFYSGPNSVFLSIASAAVREACQRHPGLYPLVLAEVGKRMRLLMGWTGQSVLLQPEQRMALLICLLARNQEMPGNSGSIQVTQQRLAGLARCSRQSANALLATLEQKGLIRLAYGKCEIPDLAGLHAYSQTDDEA